MTFKTRLITGEILLLLPDPENGVSSSSVRSSIAFVGHPFQVGVRGHSDYVAEQSEHRLKLAVTRIGVGGPRAVSAVTGVAHGSHITPLTNLITMPRAEGMLFFFFPF